MKPRNLLHALFLVTGCAALAFLMAGCLNPLQYLSTTEASTGSITGTVVTQGGMDKSGITVTAELTDGMRSISVQKLISGTPRAGRAIAAQAETDTSGEYTLTGLPPGTYTLNASSKDALERAVTTTVNVCAGSRVEAPLLRLTRTGELAGTVTLKGETNHLGIVVFIAGTSYSAMTAANGAYTMSFVPAGKGYTLVASKAGYDSAITNVNVSIGRTTQVEPLVLAPHVTPPTTGSVFGIAHLEGAATNAGVFVYLAGTSHIAVTDVAGSFNLTGVAPGTTYTLVASKEGYSMASCPVGVEAGSDWDAGVLTLTPLGPFFVVYNGNGAEGGSVPTDATSYLPGSIVTVLGNSGNLVKAYHGFEGWNTRANGTGASYTQGETFAMGNSDVILYTRWTPLPGYTAKDITAFGFTQASNPSLPPAGVVADISGTSISATVPFGQSLTNLVATFVTTGLTVKVGGMIQASGVTANDFTAPVTYVVTAPDGSQKTYSVTVVNAAEPEVPEYVGTWLVDNPNTNGGPVFAKAEITFGAELSYEGLFYDAGGILKGGSARGTYTASNNILYCQMTEWYDGSNWIVISVLSIIPYSVSGDQLTISNDMDRDGTYDVTWVLTRQ